MNKEYVFFELAKECEKLLRDMGFQLCVDSSYKNKICLKALDTNVVWSKDMVLEAFESFTEVAAFIRGWDKHRIHKLAEAQVKK